MPVDALLKPLKVGQLTLPNRFIVAPLTRCRAGPDHVPTDDVVEHYAQRAGFGLILSEAAQIQEGYSTFARRECGIYGPKQVDGWRRVTDAVHAKGGRIFCQLHHGGRATVPCNVDDGLRIVGPSALGITGHQCQKFFAADGRRQPYLTEVHMLSKEEIAQYVQLYVTAAKNAMAAGFDGVEIHGANGYLIDQFVRDSSNKRTDEYGGSIENRVRFLFEVVDAVVAAVGNDRVGLRISPLNPFNGMSDSNPEALTRHICRELNRRQIAFLDILRGDFFSDVRGADVWARDAYDGVLFSGLGYELAEAEAAVAGGACDGVCFGGKSIANPDLVARAIAGAELNVLDPSTYYVGGSKGYTDYPTLQDAKAQ